MGPCLNADERRILLEAARDSLEVAVFVREPRILAEESQGQLGEPGACFVTLRASGQLRGCIGGLEARLPLCEHARTMAGAAALRDPRFPPVLAAELSRIAVSLSVLTPLRRVCDPCEVLVGEHGVVVSRGWLRGVLLPQVAVEQCWDRETFLAHTCQKAGLPPNAWRDPETVIDVFAAEVFGESS